MQIVRGWTRDYPKPKGWQYKTVQTILVNPRLAGLRVYQEEVISEAVWPPIITKDQHERIAAIFKSRRRGENPVGVSLLTGLVVCGRCGARLRRSEDTFRCRRKVGEPDGCGTTTVMVRHVEPIVVEDVLNALENWQPPKPGKGNKKNDGAVEMAEVEDRLKELAEAYA